VRILSDFSELIKNFDKIRDYMRDFYVYGFKSREDFNQKSSRTYDNEKRRIESYLGKFIRWDTSKAGKCVFISIDSSKISQNPLYAAWKSKSFTTNDIILHFYLLDTLKTDSCLSINELTNSICEQSGMCFDTQTVRIKVNEYVNEGIVTTTKHGKALLYNLSDMNLKNIGADYEDMLDVVKYYQEAAPFGVVGSFLLDNEQQKNDIFSFKHHFIVHTLEDKILLELLSAMKDKRKVHFVNQSKRLDRIVKQKGVPLKIFVSSQSGRRYVTFYNERRNRFINYRLDYIKSIEALEECDDYDLIKEKLEGNLNKCWGVSFGGGFRGEKISIKLYIDEEKEAFIINRLKREGRDGAIERVDKDIYSYSTEIFDTNEIMFWVKSFTGRILAVECENKVVVDKFYRDMKRMQKMYSTGE
jgi:hypothetical protein